MPRPTETLQPRIYVACLAAYNNGYLHGEWVDATDDLGLIQAQVARMLAASPIPDAEEYAIHDYEAYGGYDLGEYAGLETAHNIAIFLADTGKLGAMLLTHFGGDLEDAQSALEEYAGCYETIDDFAQELTEETTTIPENLRFYIDYDAMARDMQLNGDILTFEESYRCIHILWAR